jgi:hypothetical protein
MAKRIFETLAWSSGVDSSLIPQGFFAYAAAPPSIPEIVRAAVESINKIQVAQILTWESVQVGGKYIIAEICEAIDEADFFCADITTINANVLFELGYAIARDKRIWLIRDDSYTDAKKEFDQLRMLTTVGYSPYLNVDQIVKAFFSEKPHSSLDQTVYRQSVEPLLGPKELQDAIVYLKSRFDTEASVRVTRILQDSKLPLIVDDPSETSVQPLNWYAQKLFGAISLATHFLSPTREGHRLHNARYALVSGLARGFEVPTLMLVEQSDLLSPIDYRDALRLYTTPAEAAKETHQWLEPILLKRGTQNPQPKQSYADALKLATELKDFHLQIGEYVAENESQHLAEYFVETTAFMDVINGTHSIFVGRKGTGKTTNFIKAAAQIGVDVQNLVVLIKPVGYEIEGLARLFSAYKAQDYKGYVIESLWKFMLYTEIAHAAVEQIQESALWQLSNGHAQRLLLLLEESNSPFAGEFTVRLERIVKTLSAVPSEGEGGAFRSGISEALHSGALATLRASLGDVLSKKRRVILLIDNLDKPWTRSADLDRLSEFLVGLLNAANRVDEELRQRTKQRAGVRFNSAIFLRSDIFDRITTVMEEPDKLSYTRLSWNDPELLLRIIEERYSASHGAASDPATMWRRYFCAQVKGIPTREYLTMRILPRPRDIVFLVKSAVSFAVNRKHDRVEEKDVLDAEKQYSQYALDSILVEGNVTIPQLESVFLEFLASEPVLTESEVRQYVSSAGVEAESVDDVIAHLVRLTFLGLEVGEGRFEFSDQTRELKKIRLLAERYARGRNSERRLEVNSAFRSYLEISG